MEVIINKVYKHKKDTIKQDTNNRFGNIFQKLLKTTKYKNCMIFLMDFVLRPKKNLFNNKIKNFAKAVKIKSLKFL